MQTDVPLWGREVPTLASLTLQSFALLSVRQRIAVHLNDACSQTYKGIILPCMNYGDAYFDLGYYVHDDVYSILTIIMLHMFPLKVRCSVVGYQDLGGLKVTAQGYQGNICG